MCERKQFTILVIWLCLKFGVCAVFASLILLHLTIAPRTQLQGGGEQISKILRGKSKRDHRTHMWIVHYILSNFLLDCCWFAVAKNHTIIYYGANFLRPAKKREGRNEENVLRLRHWVEKLNCVAAWNEVNGRWMVHVKRNSNKNNMWN